MSLQTILRGGFLALAVFVSSPAAAAELVMFDSPGCHWCERWDAEVGGIYPRTDEARTAPIRRVALHAARPDDLAFIDRVRFTPTFVLVEDGREIGRIEGYPGDAFFWGLLNRMIDDLPQTPHGQAIGTPNG